MSIKQLIIKPTTQSVIGSSKTAKCSKCCMEHARRSKAAVGVMKASSSKAWLVDRVSGFAFAITIAAICCKSAFSDQYSSLPLDRAKFLDERSVLTSSNNIFQVDTTEA